MRLTHLLPIQQGKSSLMEGVTFGQKQMSMVQQSDNVQVGIEYEFTLGSPTNEREDEWQEIYEEEYERLEAEDRDGLESELERNTPNADDLSRLVLLFSNKISIIGKAMETIKGVVYVSPTGEVTNPAQVFDNEKDYDEVADALFQIARAFVALYKNRDEMRRELTDMDDTLYTFALGQQEYRYDDYNALLNTIGIIEEELDDSFVNLNDLNLLEDPIGDLGENAYEEVFEVYVTNIGNPLSAWDNDVVTHPTKAGITQESAEEDIEEQIRNWINSRVDDNIDHSKINRWARQAANDQIPNGNGDMGVESHAAKAQELLDQQGDLMDDIDEVHPDGPGLLAEAKGSLVDIEESIEHMHGMLDFIQEYGYTDTRAGMHVNISLKDSPMVNENFNPIKLAVLMDDGYIQQTFPERKYTGMVWGALDAWTLMDIIDPMVEEASQPELNADIVEVIERSLIKNSNFDGKRTNININNVRGEYREDNRVEFRYFGGPKYDYRGEELEFQIYRASYSLMAAFDDEFLRREYIDSLWNTLNDKVEETFGRSFSDVYRMMKEARKSLPPQDYLQMIGEFSVRPSNVENIYQNHMREAQGKERLSPNPGETLRSIIKANSDDINEIIDEYFDILISVLERNNYSSFDEVRTDFNRSKMFKPIASEEFILERIDAIATGELDPTNRKANVPLEQIGTAVARMWLEGESERDIFRRFDQRVLQTELKSIMAFYVGEYMKNNRRMMKELSEQLDFIRLS